MIIANPIYDVVFKYLMEDLDIAKGMISAIIGEQVEELHFQTREQVVARARHEIHPHLVSLQRLDFVARIRTEDGKDKKILIELQKARLSSDISRFRSYLGKRYQERDEVREAGGLVKKGLPIVVIYILGFDLEPDMPACVKVDRRYLNLITGRRIKAECDFIEGLSHDLYVIQAGKLNHKVKTDLERILSVFGQVDFADEHGHDIDFPESSRESDLVKQIIRRLAKVREEADVRESMDFEDLIYEEFETGLKERTATLTQKLKLTSGKLDESKAREEEAKAREEEAKAREEEAKAREEEERRQKEELAKTALKALTDAGIPKAQARKQLGLD